MRDVTIDHWGTAVLEELLFRAGRDIGDHPPADAFEMTIPVRITADAESGSLRIVALDDGNGDPVAATLDRPF
jgi:hypothetical protein